MEKLLKLMLDGEALSTEQMGEILGLTKDQLDAEFKKLSDAGILLGWRPVINPDVEESMVHAAIELRINPERDGGFDRLAQRISRFDQVDSCYLMSGRVRPPSVRPRKIAARGCELRLRKTGDNRRGDLYRNALLPQNL